MNEINKIENTNKLKIRAITALITVSMVFIVLCILIFTIFTLIPSIINYIAIVIMSAAKEKNITPNMFYNLLNVGFPSLFAVLSLFAGEMTLFKFFNKKRKAIITKLTKN